MPVAQCGLWAALLQFFQFTGEWMRWRFVPSSSASHQIETSSAKRLLCALQLLIRKIWWGSESCKSLWSLTTFWCSTKHWMPWESCKPCCAFGVPCWIPESVSPGGRMSLRQVGLSAMIKAKITLNWCWTLGLIPVHEHGSWRGYKNTWFFFLGGRRRMPVFENELPSREKEPP